MRVRARTHALMFVSGFTGFFVQVSKVGRKTLGFSITFRTMQRPPEPEPVVPVVPNELILVAPDGAEVEGVVDLHALLELDLAADDPALQPAPETVAVVTSIEPDVQINGDGELRVGDVIVAVDGVAIAGISAAQLIGMLNGDEVEVTVRAMQPAPLTHGADAADAAPDAEFTVMLERGTGRKPLAFEIAITPKDRRVEVTKVNPHGLAKLLKPGDCVRAINKIELASLPDLSMAWIRGLVDRDKVDLSITRKLSSGIDPQEGCTIC